MSGAPVRILVISNLFPDPKQPTFGTFIAAHVSALRRAGAEVEVVAIRGVRVHENIGRKYARLMIDALLLAFRDLRRRRSPQVVEAHIAFPTVAIAWPVARLSGARLVVYCHGSDVTEVGVRSATHRRLARFLFRRADLMVANSRHTASVLAANFGIAGERVVVWSPGIDTDFFHVRPDVERDPRRILFVGRLHREKGVDVLIDAVAALPPPQPPLRIVGAGPERERLEAMAESRRVAAEFAGPLSPERVAREMASAAVVVVPSTYQEPLGLVALEGMATGALVVATASGGLAESIEPGRSGWLVSPGDAADLGRALREALGTAQDDASASRVGALAMATAREHDIYAVARQTVAAYAQLVRQGAA
jgi:glycosyltransferase involved in cell wall biosynthesis